MQQFFFESIEIISYVNTVIPFVLIQHFICSSDDTSVILHNSKRITGPLEITISYNLKKRNA